MPVDGKEPTTVIVVQRSKPRAFQHCPKALLASDLWKAGSGDRPKGVPTLKETPRRAHPARPHWQNASIARLYLSGLRLAAGEAT